MWMEISELWSRCSEYWVSWLLTMLLHSLAYIFGSVSKTNFEYQFVLFQVYGNIVEEIIMYQQLQKICREKVYRIKVFRENLENFGQNILCTPKKLPAPMLIYDMPACNFNLENGLIFNLLSWNVFQLGPYQPHPLFFSKSIGFSIQEWHDWTFLWEKKHKHSGRSQKNFNGRTSAHKLSIQNMMCAVSNVPPQRKFVWSRFPHRMLYEPNNWDRPSAFEWKMKIWKGICVCTKVWQAWSFALRTWCVLFAGLQSARHRPMHRVHSLRSVRHSDDVRPGKRMDAIAVLSYFK